MKDMYDAVVIGGGPAGLTAALYLARARYRVVVVEKEKFGGQITITHEVVNYPGVEKTSGKALTAVMRAQAESFGAEFLLAEVEKIEVGEEWKLVKTNRGELKTYGILLATGAHPRMIGFRGEEEFRGRGVAYCATCDGEFFTGKEVFVIGGGFAAAEEAVFLTKYARHVNILIRRDDFSCAASTAQAAKDHEKITVFYNTVAEEVFGDSKLRGIRYKNLQSGEITEYEAESGENIGVFVFAGYEPATELAKGLVELDSAGYVVTDRVQKTNIDGIYAAGDVCIKPLRQVVTAVGDGALAATELEKYAAKMQKKTGIVPKQLKKEAPEVPVGEQRTIETSNSQLFDGEMLAQLNAVFSRMENPLILKLYLDSRPVSAELKEYMEELSGLTDKLTLEIVNETTEADPCVEICYQDGSYSGLAFHGVPGGHEFTSFVLGLYNASGEGQKVEDALKDAFQRIEKRADMKVLVSLSCTMCPELVIAAQKAASLNPNITAEIYDINHFPEMKERYQVMSVPCLVINDGEKVSFGKKNLLQLSELINSL